MTQKQPQQGSGGASAHGDLLRGGGELNAGTAIGAAMAPTAAPTMAPQVGMTVQYGVEGSERIGGERMAEPRAAIIVGVNGDGTVDLRVFHPGIDTDTRTRAGYADALKEGCWTYPQAGA
jgi:hypothetical protein